MEEAFTKLKQVTGVKNVEEMHEKFSNQKSNKLQLELEVKDAEQRLATVKKAYAKQETIFQELKSSGSGIAELNRDNINKLEEAYSDAKNEQKFIRADLERISTVLLGLHQGSQGLSQRTQPYLVLAEGGVFELTQVGEEASPWTETVDALTTSEHVLTKMMEAIVGDGSGPGGNFEDNEEDNESTFSKESRSLETQEEAPDFTNNVRIRSKKYHRDLDAEDERDLEGFKDKDDNGVDLLIPGVLAEVEEDENDVLMPTNGPRDISMINQGDDNAKVPSRLAMKKVSKDLSLDAKRKKEMEIRRKRLLDRMEGVNRGGPDDAKIGMTATYRAQIAAGERLCVDKKPPTLPDGVTLRDDPMKKTIAFLNSMPNLK